MDMGVTLIVLRAFERTADLLAPGFFFNKQFYIKFRIVFLFSNFTTK